MNENLPIGQGHGISGRYAGLPDKFCNITSSEIVILPVPFDQTSTYQKGSSNGPKALIEASRNMELYDIETESEVYQKGIFTDVDIKAETSELMLKLTYQRTKELLNLGKFVIAIGGEHSISYASIRAHAEYNGSLTVLQFDAHSDLQNTYENNPWSHACVMSRVREIPQVTKIVSVGIRSMSAEELANFDRSNTFFAHELDENGKWMDRVLQLLTDPLYITIDLDVFDSSLMPSTGTPEPGGLQWNQFMIFLKKIVSEKKMVGFDVVELCPSPCNPAPDYLAAKLIYKLISYKFYSNKLG